MSAQGTDTVTITNAPYFTQLDGLRAIAVTIVLWQHAGDGRLLDVGRNGIGVYGVWLFFVLSGFLITGILLRTRERVTDTSVTKALATFYKRRFLRIFPAYYLALIIAACLSYGQVRSLAALYVTYTVNWYIYGNGWTGAGGHIWSLCIEEQFYLCWPLLVLSTPRRYLGLCFAGLIATAPIARYFILRHTGSSVSVLVATPSCLDSLGIGAVLAWAWHSRRISQANINLVCRAAGLIGLVLTTFMLAQQGFHLHIHDIPDPEVLENVFEASAVSLVSVYAVNRAAVGFTNVLGSILDYAPVQYLGRISYGIYLYHAFVIATLDRAVGANHGIWRFTVVYMITIALASLSWKYFERPIIALKGRLAPTGVSPDFGVATSAL